jgi:hypothetical protein
VVIDLGLPYTGHEVLEPGRIRVPFASGESARRAASTVKVTVSRDPEVVTGEVIVPPPAIGPAAGGHTCVQGLCNDHALTAPRWPGHGPPDHHRSLYVKSAMSPPVWQIS